MLTTNNCKQILKSYLHYLTFPTMFKRGTVYSYKLMKETRYGILIRGQKWGVTESNVITSLLCQQSPSRNSEYQDLNRGTICAFSLKWTLDKMSHLAIATIVSLIYILQRTLIYHIITVLLLVFNLAESKKN